MNEALARFEQYLKGWFGQSSTPIHYINDLKIFVHIIGDKEPEAVTTTDKERIVWLTPSLWATLQAWLQVRPHVESDALFLNHRGQPIKVNGIQYRLAQHSQIAGVTLSCHRLRHTFSRRLAENGLPIDSLAKLLGHTDLQTTQRYIDGADPTVRDDFTEAMKHLETTFIRDRKPPALPEKPSQQTTTRTAPEAELLKLRQQLEVLPHWLAEAVDAYLSWRWPTWRAQTAYQLGINLVNLVRRIWAWLATHRQIDGWETFRRVDLETWLQARHQDGVSDVTIRNDLARFHSLLKFLENRDYPLDPGLFRVQPPKKSTKPLPRYLSESDYGWLETSILQATEGDTYNACFDRAWFLMLAHMRKLLGHQHLNTTQIYARIYDETLYEQFKDAMSRLEATAVSEWAGAEKVRSLPASLGRAGR